MTGDPLDRFLTGVVPDRADPRFILGRDEHAAGLSITNGVSRVFEVQCQHGLFDGSHRAPRLPDRPHAERVARRWMALRAVARTSHRFAMSGADRIRGIRTVL